MFKDWGSKHKLFLESGGGLELGEMSGSRADQVVGKPGWELSGEKALARANQCGWLEKRGPPSRGGRRLKTCIMDHAGIQQLLDRLEYPAGRPQQFQMLFMMHIGPEQIDILLFYQPFCQLLGLGPIVSAEG